MSLQDEKYAACRSGEHDPGFKYFCLICGTDLQPEVKRVNMFYRIGALSTTAIYTLVFMFWAFDFCQQEIGDWRHLFTPLIILVVSARSWLGRHALKWTEFTVLTQRPRKLLAKPRWWGKTLCGGLAIVLVVVLYGGLIWFLFSVESAKAYIDGGFIVLGVPLVAFMLSQDLKRYPDLSGLRLEKYPADHPELPAFVVRQNESEAALDLEISDPGDKHVDAREYQ